jgi:hypothetical protein
MSNTFFIFFQILGTAPLLDVPRLPPEKVSARLNFAALVPITITTCHVYTPKGRGAVPKILGTGAHF